MALEITTNNLEELIASGKPVVIDFWAEWCGPCRMLTPIIEELAGEYENDVIIGKCNVDDNNDVSMKYGIRNIPTVIFLKGGEVVDKQVGACSKAALAEKIENLKYSSLEYKKAVQIGQPFLFLRVLLAKKIPIAYATGISLGFIEN